MEGCQGLSRAGIWGDKEREREREQESLWERTWRRSETGECMCSRRHGQAVCSKQSVLICCSSMHTPVFATMYAFACMSMLMSTHSWGQALTHKWNLATWVPRSLSWACTAADLASLSGAVSTRQDSKRRAWRGRMGRGGGLVTSRELLPKSRLLSLGREAPYWHSASAEKLESSIVRSTRWWQKSGKEEPQTTQTPTLCIVKQTPKQHNRAEATKLLKNYWSYSHTQQNYKQCKQSGFWRISSTWQKEVCVCDSKRVNIIYITKRVLGVKSTTSHWHTYCILLINGSSDGSAVAIVLFNLVFCSRTL